MSNRARIFLSKAEDLLPRLPADSFDSIVCDPPYGLAELKPALVTKALNAWLGGDRWHVPDGRGFMGREWDKFVPPPGIWDECFRVLKPGSWLLAFSAPRTADLMGMSIRLSGFEVFDSLHWMFGQGFPKAKSRLKPGHEPIIMARKPAKTNPPLPGLDGCKVTHINGADLAESQGKNRHADFGSGPRDNQVFGADERDRADQGNYDGSAGRWPPNLLLTHSADCQLAGTRRVNGTNRPSRQKTDRLPAAVYGDPSGQREIQAYADADGTETVQAFTCAPGCPVAGLDAQSGVLKSGTGSVKKASAAGVCTPSASIGRESRPAGTRMVEHTDSLTGGASRFFPQFTWSPEYDLPFLYQAKAPKKERPRIVTDDGRVIQHPTVKPLALCRWLVRLVTPPDGTVGDFFTGTGPVVQAALEEGMRCVACDQDPDSVALARVRLAAYAGVKFTVPEPAEEAS